MGAPPLIAIEQRQGEHQKFPIGLTENVQAFLE
jgi:hypothetical protein